MGRVKDGDGKSPAKPQPPTKKKYNPADNLPKVRKPTQGRQKTTLENMTEGQLFYCRRYSVHGNGQKAAREAGFEASYPYWASQQPAMVAKIKELRQIRADKFNISPERVLAEIAKVAFSNVSDFVELSKDGQPRIDCTDVGRDELASLKEIEQDVYYEKTGPEEGDVEPVKRTKIKFYDKLRALEMLGTNLGMFTKKELDELSPDDKAARIRSALRKMLEVDGEPSNGQ